MEGRMREKKGVKEEIDDSAEKHLQEASIPSQTVVVHTFN